MGVSMFKIEHLRRIAMKKSIVGLAAASTLALGTLIGISSPAEAARSIQSRTCASNAVVNASTSVYTKTRHTHTYVAQSGAKTVRLSEPAVLRFVSGSGYNRATVTMTTPSVESFEAAATYCFTIG